MKSTDLFLGIDLGTSGVRIVVIDANKTIIHSDNISYPSGLAVCSDWESCCIKLITEIPSSIRNNLKACSIDGTSGTLVSCQKNGDPISEALPYYMECIEQKAKILQLVPDNQVDMVGSSFARALQLISQNGMNSILRHQADWMSGWFIDDWRYGEESNNLKLGWNPIKSCWPKAFANLAWRESLPKVVKTGQVIGKLSSAKARILGLPQSMLIIAGTTDSNAAVITANPTPEEGITVLGSTIVLKRFVETPLKGAGITNHRICDHWLAGGSSNAGGAVLKKFFSEQQIKELSKQINPEVDSNIKLRPLPFAGERFPINDPTLQPILGPRPVSDSLYLHALLESLAEIEAQGWRRLVDLGAEMPKRIVTIGGGASNPQWKRLRERKIGVQIRRSTNPPAQGVAMIALTAILNRSILNDAKNS